MRSQRRPTGYPFAPGVDAPTGDAQLETLSAKNTHHQQHSRRLTQRSSYRLTQRSSYRLTQRSSNRLTQRSPYRLASVVVLPLRPIYVHSLLRHGRLLAQGTLTSRDRRLRKARLAARCVQDLEIGRPSCVSCNMSTTGDMNEYFTIGECPLKDECTTKSFGRAKCWGWTPEEARAKLLDHLKTSGLHQASTPDGENRDEFYESLVRDAQVHANQLVDKAARRKAAPRTPPDAVPFRPVGMPPAPPRVESAAAASWMAMSCRSESTLRRSCSTISCIVCNFSSARARTASV